MYICASLHGPCVKHVSEKPVQFKPVIASSLLPLIVKLKFERIDNYLQLYDDKYKFIKAIPSVTVRYYLLYWEVHALIIWLIVEKNLAIVQPK